MVIAEAAILPDLAVAIVAAPTKGHSGPVGDTWGRQLSESQIFTKILVQQKEATISHLTRARSDGKIQ